MKMDNIKKDSMKTDEHKKFNSTTRNDNILKQKSEVFDLVIVGGGITGAGVARDATSRGMKVALIEASDFASGTSSRSSKLIHGGIRYLENLEFKLVFEALSERTLLFEMAPHLVHPLRFMIPFFKQSRVSMFEMGLGMWLYDALALFRSPELHERLNAQETHTRQSEVRTQDLLGSFVYSDAYMDDDRLVIETLRSAHTQGAVITNYTEVTKYEHSEQNHILSVKDLIDGNEYQVKAKQIISCVGPWTDIFGKSIDKNWKNKLRPSKGIHLIFSKQRLPLNQAVVMAVEKSQRIIFGIPRDEFIIIGTTDTDFPTDPGQVRTEWSDVEYLLKIVNEYFPTAKITQKDIISSYSGVRPLIHDDSESVGKTSREHLITEGKNGVVFIAGGKYTTYRKMAEEAVDFLLKKLTFDQRIKFSPSNTKIELNPLVTKDNYENYLDSQTEKNSYKLALKYGPEAEKIKQTYPADYDFWQLDAAFSIDNTMCVSVFDYYLRRSNLFLTHRDHGLSKFDRIAEIFREKLKFTPEKILQERDKLKNFIDFELGWKAIR